MIKGIGFCAGRERGNNVNTDSVRTMRMELLNALHKLRFIDFLLAKAITSPAILSNILYGCIELLLLKRKCSAKQE